MKYDHDRISTHDLIELGVTAKSLCAGDAKLPIAEAMSDVPENRLGALPKAESMPASANAEVGGRSSDDPVVPPPSETCVPECAVPAAMSGEGQLHATPSEVVSWFLDPMDTAEWPADRDATRKVHDNIERFIDNQLARKSNANLHPENREWLGAAWCQGPGVDEGRGAP